MAAIVGIVASLLGPAIELGKCIVVPMRRQFNYLCCYNSNIQNLRDEAKKLEDARDGLQMRVAIAKNNVEVIVPEVNTWLEKANDVQVSMNGIESEITSLKSGCLTIKSRFSLSKKAKKIAEAMKELQADCGKFDIISHPAPPVSMVSIPLGHTHEFTSRKHIEEDIMTTLRRKNANIIGICGMGGVGKTTMAKRIMTRVMEEHLFDEVFMVVISQPVDMLRIQDEIAKSLGLGLEGESLSLRARRLHSRLIGGTRILIVLDDVWKKLKLEELGIPCESDFKGCTILLTSRNRDIFNEMDAQKVCEVQTLSEVEAWSLFIEKAGISVDADVNLLSIAQDIAKECKGLPIALVTVGLALKNKKEKSVWNYTLQQLRSSNPVDMPKVLEDVYKPLKVSYDSLDSHHARSVFLLCCLFPEDFDIPVEDLTFYCWGLSIFERIRNLEDARDGVCALVEMLKSRYLLLEGHSETFFRMHDKNFVKMHDVVRDVAIFIASNEGLIDPNLSFMNWRREHASSNCTWISSFPGERAELLRGLTFPNLRLLRIDNKAKEEFPINDNFLDGARGLNVLSVTCDSLTSLPHAAKLLKNLRTLLLYACRSLETISVVGEMVSLEILICRQCGSIEELPTEIGRLSSLRLLELSHCWKLQKIPPGVISKLVGLEKLKMVGSFDKWEAEDNGGSRERKNAGLRELESLSNLTCLEIEVKHSALVAKQINLPLKEFSITCRQYFNFGSDYQWFHKKLLLDLQGEFSIGDWINMQLLRSSEYVASVGDGSNNLDLAKAQNIRSLALYGCSTMKNITSIDDGRRGATVFPLLESLWLSDLKDLEEICVGQIPEGSNSFKNLKVLSLRFLPALKHLWDNPYQNVSSLCSNLSRIEISGCYSLRSLFSLAMAKEQVLPSNEGERNNDIRQSRRHIRFSKLKILKLNNLPMLASFCEGIQSIEFPLLTEMDIEWCPKMTSLVSSSGGIDIGRDHGEDDEESLHLFCKPKVVFGSLKQLCIRGYEKIRSNTLLWCDQIPIDFFMGLEELTIGNCGNMRSLFSSPILTANLVNLRKLTISRCGEMVKVIEGDKEKDTCGSERTICLFPRLQFLSLSSLSKLEFFCEWTCALELPSLEKVEIKKCSKMGRFSLGSVTTSNLKTIQIGYQGVINTKDLNGMLQQSIFRVKEEERKMTENRNWEEDQEEEED